MKHKDIAILRKDIANYVFNGGSINDAAVRFNKSMYQVQSACKQFGVTYPRRIAAKPVTVFLILKELFDINNTLQQIGEKFNVSSQHVSQIYIKAKEAKIPGLPLRQKSRK